MENIEDKKKLLAGLVERRIIIKQLCKATCDWTKGFIMVAKNKKIRRQSLAVCLGDRYGLQQEYCDIASYKQLITLATVYNNFHLKSYITELQRVRNKIKTLTEELKAS